MLLSAVSVLVVAQSSSEIPEGLMNNPVYVEGLIWTAVVQDWAEGRTSVNAVVHVLVPGEQEIS